MAWYEGTMPTNGVGELLAVLDAKLPLNARWSIYDAAAGVNCKVYRNYDAGGNVNYYVKVDDNYVGYAIIEFWEGWDAGTHTGIGASLTVRPGSAETLRIFKAAGGWGLSLRDHRFIFCEFNTYSSNYIGQLKRFDLTKNMPCIVCNTSGGVAQNALGISNAVGVATACLFDELGNIGRVIISVQMGSGLLLIYIKTIVGTFLILEALIFNDTTKNLMGQYEGAVALYQSSQGLSNGDIVTVAGIDWICMGKGARFSLIEKG